MRSGATQLVIISGAAVISALLLYLAADNFVLSTPPAPQAGSAAEGAASGEMVFQQCKNCHAVGPGAKAGIGPAQNNLIGSRAGSRPGYDYSAAMKEAGGKGLVWSAETLDEFLQSPAGFLPGNKMAFPGLKNPKDRANVIAYLRTQTQD